MTNKPFQYIWHTAYLPRDITRGQVHSLHDQVLNGCSFTHSVIGNDVVYVEMPQI
jgi:hypothetical protein